MELRRSHPNADAGEPATTGRPELPDTYRDGYEAEPRPVALGAAFVGLSAVAWLLAGEAFTAGLAGIHGLYGLFGGLVATAALPAAWPATVEARERVRAVVGRWLGYQPVIYRQRYVQPHVKMPGALVDLRDNTIGLVAPLVTLNAVAVGAALAAVHPVVTYLAAVVFLYNTVASASDVQGVWLSVGLPDDTLLYYPAVEEPTVVVYEPEAAA